MVQAKKSTAKPVKVSQSQPANAEPAKLEAVAPVQKQVETVKATNQKAFDAFGKTADKATRGFGEAFAALGSLSTWTGLWTPLTILTMITMVLLVIWLDIAPYRYFMDKRHQRRRRKLAKKRG